MEDFTQRKLLAEGQRQWLEDHDNEVQSWADENLEDEADGIALYRNVVLGDNDILGYLFYVYLQNRDESPERKFIKVVNKIRHKDGAVIPVIGPRRRGKTSLVYAICEYLHNFFGFHIWWLGPPAKLPSFIDGQTLDDSKIPKGSIIIYDEAAIQSSSRTTYDKEQKEFVAKLAVTGHHGKFYFILCQNASIFDLNFLRQADSIIFVGQTFITLKNTRLIVNEYLNYFMPKRVGDALFYDDDLIIDFSWQLPTWWREKYSKPYAPFVSEIEMYKFVFKILDDFPRIENDKLLSFLHKRDARMEEHQLEYVRQLAESYGVTKLLSMNDKTLDEVVQKGYDDTPIQDILLKKHSGMKKYEWEQDLMVKEYWKNKFKEDPTLEIKMQINRNDLLIDYIKQKGKESHLVVGITGPTDSGKSLGSISLGECIGIIYKKSFHVKNHVFETPNSMIESNKTAQKHDSLILDDQRKRYGPFANKEQWDLSNMVQALRKKQVNFIFNSPDIKITFTPKFYLEAFGFNRKECITKMLISAPDLKPLGYITMRKPNEQNIKEYTEFEDTFKEKIKQRDASMSSPATERIEQTVEELISDPKFLLRETQRERMAYIMKKGHGMDMANMILAEVTATMRERGLLKKKSDE
mgnify:FL=1